MFKSSENWFRLDKEAIRFVARTQSEIHYMKDLDKLRQEIDQIDDRIVELIAERFKSTDEIGLLKAHNYLPGLDSKREKQIMTRLKEKAESLSLNPELITNIFRAILLEVVSKHNSLTGDDNNTEQ